jgi:hypothetical protein
MRIHHIKMKPIYTGVFGGLNLSAELGEIGGENGGGEFHVGVYVTKFACVIINTII